MAGQKPLALESGVLTQINDPDQIKVPDGSASAPGLLIGGSSGFWNDITNSGVGISVGGVQVGFHSALGPTFQVLGGGTLNAMYVGEGGVNNIIRRYSTNATAPNLFLDKARGTVASPSVPVTNDNIGTPTFRAWTGATFTSGAQIRAVLVETSAVDPTHVGSRFTFFLCPIGSGTLAEVVRFDNEAGLSLFGANPVIDQNRVFRPRAYTVGTVPAVTATGLIDVTDEGGGGCIAYADGTSWRRISDLQVLTASTPTSRGLLGRMTSRVAYVNQDIVQRTYQKLATAGVVLGTDLLGLWVFAGAPTSQADALRNWATLGTRDLTIIGSPTWSQLGGFTGDGTSAILDTGATPATFGAAQNNVSVGVYVLAASGTAKAVIGQSLSSLVRAYYFQSAGSGALVTRLQDGTNDNYTPSKWTGMFTLTRGAAANFQASVDDGAQTTITRTSTTAGNKIGFLGTADTTGSEFSTAQIAFAFIGVNLTAAKIAAIRAVMVDYYLVQTGVLSSTYTVANLPGASAAYEGQRIMVSDATVAASGNFGATLTGGSTNHVPAYYESGTPAWRIG